MKIRKAISSDLPEIVDLGKEYMAYHKYLDHSYIRLRMMKTKMLTLEES